MDTPGSGRIAASGSYSSALLVLKGRAAASCCVAAIFAVRSSEESTSGFGSAGPETVARLFGSMASGVSGRGFFELAIIQLFLWVRLFTSTSPVSRAGTCLTGGVARARVRRAQGRGRDGQTWNNRRHCC
jgi:hypothetical protein